MMWWDRCREGVWLICGLLHLVSAEEMMVLLLLLMVGGLHSLVPICPFEGLFARWESWWGKQGCETRTVCTVLLRYYGSSID
jgi:hypothetical protein